MLTLIALLCLPLVAQAQALAPAPASASATQGSTMAQVGISPPFIDIGIAEAARTQSFRFHNFTGGSKRVRVSLALWTLNARDEIELLPSTDSSIDQWVIVNPSEFTTRADASQVVRFSVRPALELPTGEHRFFVVLDELADPDGGGMLQARFQLRSAVYIQVGAATRGAELSDLRADSGGISFRLRATGTANARFQGQMALFRAAEFPGTAKTSELPGIHQPDFKPPPGALFVINLPANPVLPGTERAVRIEFPVKVPDGAYQLDFNGKLGDAELDRAFPVSVLAKVAAPNADSAPKR